MWISHNHENWLEKAVQYLLAGLTVGPELKIRKDFQVNDVMLKSFSPWQLSNQSGKNLVKK